MTITPTTVPNERGALIRSILHWKRLAEGTQYPDEKIGPSWCALCQRQLALQGFTNHVINCTGCPVQRHTNKAGCMNTPCEAAQEAYFCFGIDSPEFRAAAKAEHAFLVSLLPSTQPKEPTP